MTSNSIKQWCDQLERHGRWLRRIDDDHMLPYIDEVTMQADGMPSAAERYTTSPEAHTKTLNLAVPGATYSDQAEKELRRLEDSETKRLSS